ELLDVLRVIITDFHSMEEAGFHSFAQFVSGHKMQQSRVSGRQWNSMGILDFHAGRRRTACQEVDVFLAGQQCRPRRRDNVGCAKETWSASAAASAAASAKHKYNSLRQRRSAARVAANNPARASNPRVIPCGD